MIQKFSALLAALVLGLTTLAPTAAAPALPQPVRVR
jgi:hypothetical protein